VPFLVTSATTGESHTIVTDANGCASTAASWNPHTADTNGGTAESGVWFGGGEPERLKVPGLDSFWWAGDEQLSRREDPCQCVVARRGNCVLMFSYTGHKDLRIQTDYFAAVLMKFQ